MTDIYTWSTTPGDNASADSGINFAEGQDPDTVNNSARQVMGRVAEFVKDSSASRASTGSGNSYAVTSDGAPSNFNKSFLVSFVADKSNTGAATMAVDALATKPLRAKTATDLAPGEIQAGTLITAMYYITGDEYLMLGHGQAVTALGPGIGAAYQATLRVGDVVLSIGATPQTGRLRLGEATQTFDPLAYPELSQWLVADGSPWGANTLPSAAGYFLRFGGTTTTVDPDGPRLAGSTQTDGIKSHDHGPGSLAGSTDTNTHKHSYHNANNTVKRDSGSADTAGVSGGNTGNNSHSHVVTLTSGLSDQQTGGLTETRGTNVAMHADIIANATQANADVFGVVGVPYKFESSTAVGDPGSGRLAGDNAALASITKAYISEAGATSENFQSLIDAVTGNYRLHFWKVGLVSTYAIYDVSSVSGTAGDGYRTLNLTHVNSGGTFTDDDNISVLLLPAGLQGIQGDSGTTTGVRWNFDSSITMADPGSGDVRLNDVAFASVTSIAFSANSGATGNPDVSDYVANWDDSTSTNKGHLIGRQTDDPSAFVVFEIASVTDNTTWLEVSVTHVVSGVSWSATDQIVWSFSRTGDKGDTGSAGAAGTDPGLLYTFSTTTTDSDPGAGILRANDASLASATALYIDDLDRSSNNHEASILGWDDVSNMTLRGQLIISTPSDGAQVVFNITGASTDNVGYTALAVTYSSGATSFADAAEISVQFIPSGNDGAGAVDSVYGRTGAVVAAASDYDITQVDFAASDRIGGRVTAGAGLAEELTAAQVRTLINVADGATANAGDMLGSNNLSELTSIATAWARIKLGASTTATGVVELATDAEVQTGTDSSRAVTASSITAKEATSAQYRNNTADYILTTDQVWSAMSEVALTDAATVSWDMDTGIDFSLTLGGNRTLSNPTNVTVGKKGRLRVVQDATGTRIPVWGTNFEFAGAAGVDFTLSTGANDEDVLYYDCISATRVLVSPGPFNIG